MSTTILSVRDLEKLYHGPQGDVRALTGVSLDVSAGDFISVQGPSGCGKTTLLLVAGGLLVPDAGRVELEGEDLYAVGGEKRAALRNRKIGFVFQQFHLIPYLSVIDNVLAPALEYSRAGVRDRARELIARLGLEGRAQHVPAQLSTGERQRTALARALLNGPRLLLADEPTGNLDTANARAVLTYLAEFAGGGGAVLLVTHDENAARAAGRRIHLEAGSIREETT